MTQTKLKIGDTYTENFRKFEVIGYDGEGSVVGREVGASAPTPTETVSSIIKEETTGIDYESKSIKELQAMCKEKGLIVRGSKADVIERLKGAE